MVAIRITDKIDVHHHVYPPAYTTALQQNGGDPSGWYVPEWTIQSDHDLCRSQGIGGTIQSITAPGAEIEKDTEKARDLARSLNESMAKVRDDEPRKYGFFATVPSLMDQEGALNEIAYALDTLHADGVTLFTRYGSDNHYLGHADFIPIWDELNKRKAIVFVHPTHPVDTNFINKWLPQPIFDYPHETGRTGIDMIVSGMLRDHAKDCKIILSHGGGDLPYLIERPAGILGKLPPKLSPGVSHDEVLDLARSFYYDTALTSGPMATSALMELLKDGYEDHVLFGSDFPNAPLDTIDHFTKQLEASKKVDVEKLRNNAIKLFPKLTG